MGLSDIAAGIEVTAEQHDPGVATVDDTAATLTERLEPFADDLPCSAPEAATVVEAYAAGNAVDACGHAASVPPVTAAKTLHLLGEQVSPVGPRGREVVSDWLAGDIARRTAMELTGLGEQTFALAAYVESHEPVPAARDAIDGALAPTDRDPLADTHSDVPDLL